MNKDELLKQKEVLQAELDKLEELIKQEEKPDYYIPEMKEEYFYIDGDGYICWDIWDDRDKDRHRREYGNCYKTLKEVTHARDVQKDLVRLQRLALTLNKGEKIDWADKSENKYYLLYNWHTHEIMQFPAIHIQGRQIYCLYNTFRTEAIKLFGEERLKEILTYQRY